MDKEEAAYYMLERRDDWVYKIVDAVKSGNTRMAWNKVKLERAFRVWNEHALYGKVLSEGILDGIIELMVETTARLDANNLLCGRTSQSPEEYLEEVLSITLDKDEWEIIWWEMTYDDSRDGISDVAVPKLLNCCYHMLYEEDYGDKLMWCDQLLSITHQRNDLSKFFIEGGKEALEILFEGELVTQS